MKINHEIWGTEELVQSKFLGKHKTYISWQGNEFDEK